MFLPHQQSRRSVQLQQRNALLVLVYRSTRRDNIELKCTKQLCVVLNGPGTNIRVDVHACAEGLGLTCGARGGLLEGMWRIIVRLSEFVCSLSVDLCDRLCWFCLHVGEYFPPHRARVLVVLAQDVSDRGLFYLC